MQTLGWLRRGRVKERERLNKSLCCADNLIKQASARLPSRIEIVSKRAKLIGKILNLDGVNNVTFDELCECAKQLGWKQNKRKGTSHITYYHDVCSDLLNLQPGKNGKAKSYQVKQLRNFIITAQMNNQLPPE